MNKKDILFINHECSRTGAPGVLLNLVKWVFANSAFTFDILSIRGGPLKNDYDNFDEHFILKNNRGPFFRTKIAYTTANFRLAYGILTAKYSLIYCNTVDSLRIGIFIKQRNSRSKLILHVHELTGTIHRLLPDFADIKDYVDGFICASHSVAEQLSAVFEIPKEKIVTIHAFIDLKQVDLLVTQTAGTSSPRRFTVGAAGLVSIRKGYDLFMQLARLVHKSRPDAEISFVWVGEIYEQDRLVIMEDLRKMRLDDMVTFTGSQANPFPYFQNFDVFLMPSREDPFPLVNLEVGHLGKPVICFKQSGGTPELLENGGGYSVDYLDLEEMLERVMEYYDDRVKCRADGGCLKEAVKQYDVNVQAPKILEIIRRFLHT